MQLLLDIVYILISLVILVFVIALFIKKEMRLLKEVTIHCSSATVFNYVKLIRNQEYYSVWVMKDPQIKIVYTGTDGTVGFTSSWQSNDKNVGVGEQEITKILEGSQMEVEIRFKKPFVATNYAVTTLTPVTASQTRLQHLFTGKSNYPMNIMNLFMDKLVGKDMQQNLENLKKILENQ